MLTLCVAMDENGLIGNNNSLPWYLPADLKHFRTITMGKPIIMGRKTHESIGHPLKGRLNVIISNNPDLIIDNCQIFNNLDKILNFSDKYNEAIVIGGMAIYTMLLPYVQRMYITRIHAKFTGDTYFPEYIAEQWQEIYRQNYLPDEKNHYSYSFTTLERLY